MWNTINKTIKRSILDQQVSVGVVSNGQQLVPFQPLKTYGLLRGFFLRSPLTTGVTVPGSGSLTMSNGAQFPQHRVIDRFRLNMQGISPLWDVDGEHIPIVSYYRRGDTKLPLDAAAFGMSVIGAFPNTDQYPYNFPTRDASLLGFISAYGPYAQYNAGGTALSLSYHQYIPITEQLVFPNTPIAQSDKMVVLNDQGLEVGLLFMQTSTQNVQPSVNLNPAYAPTNARSLLLSTGNATASLLNQPWLIYTDYYDVPVSDADLPATFQMAYAIQTTAFNTSVSGQQCTIKHKAAGLLLKAIYVGYNDTTNFGTLVDLTAGAQAALTTLQLDSGSSVVRMRETADINTYRQFRNYNCPPPGTLAFDLIQNGTWVQAIDTGKLVNVETILTLLPATVTRVGCIEVRLVPVTAGA